MIEYESPPGKGIAIGAFVRFDGPNADAVRLKILLENTLRYLSRGRSRTRPTYWLKGEPAVRQFRFIELAQNDFINKNARSCKA